MRGAPNWKDYKETKHACNNWNYSGTKQIKIYKLCKKWGKDPQAEFGKAMDELLNKLSNNNEQLEEIKQKRDYLITQIELIEKTNSDNNTIIINEKLIKDIDDHITQINSGSTYRWGYAILKKLSYRYDVNFNDVVKIFNERIPIQIKNNEYREKTLYFFKFIADRADNGILTDMEIDKQFPTTLKANI